MNRIRRKWSANLLFLLRSFLLGRCGRAKYLDANEGEM